MTFNKYFQLELQNLRELAKEFSKAHPAVGPMLSGQSSDPDVERLLEGVAFLTGLLRQKIDDDFPEIIHGLADIIFPHYLKPVPSTSIVTFTPKQNLQETIVVPAGISLASKPIDGSECIFQTCFDLEIHPLRIVAAETSTQQRGEPDRMTLTLAMTAGHLEEWDPGKLSFFLTGEYPRAAELLALLTRSVKRIILRPLSGGSPVTLSPKELKQTGFMRQNALLPFPSQSLAGFRLIQEFFLLPQKFLFLELHGWEKWKSRGQGTQFEIIFELAPGPIPVPKVHPGHFNLFTTPVINLFQHKAEPVSLNHYDERIRVRPARSSTGSYQVYSVDRVLGFSQGEVRKKEYLPLTMFSLQQQEQIMYQVTRAISPIDNSPEVLLSLAYPPEAYDFKKETLTIDITCTNGNLPERLQQGDICVQTSDSPELVDFSNIIPPTIPIETLIEGNTLWNFLSHLSLNLRALSDADSLKKLLRLYIFEGRDKTRASANLKRLEGIDRFMMNPSDRLVKGIPMRGLDVEITAGMDHFASIGDLLLFGSVLDAFFSEFVSMNTFTRLILNEMITGERYLWQERLGDRSLL